MSFGIAGCAASVERGTVGLKPQSQGSIGAAGHEASNRLVRISRLLHAARRAATLSLYTPPICSTVAADVRVPARIGSARSVRRRATRDRLESNYSKFRQDAGTATYSRRSSPRNQATVSSWRLATRLACDHANATVFGGALLCSELHRSLWRGTTMDATRSFDGLTALVTGATCGIGRAVAEEFGRLGAEVIVHGCDIVRADDVVHTITAEGGRARFLIADLENVCEVQGLARESGAVDVLVNNAA